MGSCFDLDPYICPTSGLTGPLQLVTHVGSSPAVRRRMVVRLAAATALQQRLPRAAARGRQPLGAGHPRRGLGRLMMGLDARRRGREGPGAGSADAATRTHSYVVYGMCGNGRCEERLKRDSAHMLHLKYYLVKLLAATPITQKYSLEN